VITGAEIRVTVTDLDDEGSGIASAAGPVVAGGGGATGSGLEVRIAGVLPGEDVTARIDHVSNHRPLAWATFQTIHALSPDRVQPACVAYGRCGGCVLQHYDYRAQVAWKEQGLRRQVAAHPVLAGVRVGPAVSSPDPLRYRNKSKLVAGTERDGRFILGAYAARSHDVIDLAGCAIAERPLDEVATALRDVLVAHDVVPYDERSLTGTLRHVVLRASAAREVLVTLVTAAEAFAPGAAIAAALRAQRPDVLGVVHNINPTRGNAILGSAERALAGAQSLEDQIGGVRLSVSSQAFLQANRAVAALAYRAIADSAAPAPTDVVVDAYAGVGGIALTLAPRVARVIGIEEHAAAVDDAVASAALNGAMNTAFVVGDVADRLAGVGRANVVVLNPPRKGCARAVLAQAAALAPRVIAYLSCSPDSLLRDLEILHALGYHTRDITPFDMLPHTPHLEALAILDRA